MYIQFAKNNKPAKIAHISTQNDFDFLAGLSYYLLIVAHVDIDFSIYQTIEFKHCILRKQRFKLTDVLILCCENFVLVGVL